VTREGDGIALLGADGDTDHVVAASWSGATYLEGLDVEFVDRGSKTFVGIAALKDSDAELYHDWTVPESYFTERGHEVPPGCAEIDDAERERREAESLERTGGLRRVTSR